MKSYVPRPLRRCICPVCWHEVTMRARLGGKEPIHDDTSLMAWRPPRGGAHGQVALRGDGEGWWVCESCGFVATPREVGMLLDAALWASDPQCDSIRDGMHEDVRVAMRGGE